MTNFNSLAVPAQLTTTYESNHLMHEISISFVSLVKLMQVQSFLPYRCRMEELTTSQQMTKTTHCMQLAAGIES